MFINMRLLKAFFRQSKLPFKTVPVQHVNWPTYYYLFVYVIVVYTAGMNSWVESHQSAREGRHAVGRKVRNLWNNSGIPNKAQVEITASF